MSLIGGCGDD